MGSRSKNKKRSKTERIEQEEYDAFLEDSIKKKEENIEEHWTKYRDKAVEEEVQKEKENDPKYAIFKKPLEPIMPSRSYLKKKKEQDKTERS